MLSAVAVCLLAVPGRAAADDCALLGGALVGGECVVSTSVSAAGSYAIATPLRITGAGRIVVPPTSAPSQPNSLTLNVVLTTVNTASDTVRLYFGEIRAPRK